MKFDPPLIKATLIKRHKRFLADVKLSNHTTATAHCPNTGSMKGCWKEGDTVYLSESSNPKRKLKYTWELSKTNGGYIGINTHRPNEIVLEAIKSGNIKALSGYESFKKEVKYGERSRIDLFLSGHKTEKDCFVEVKNVTLWNEKKDRVEFPDAVTTRGQKHIEELTKVVESGKRAAMFFLVNRPEGRYFSPAFEVDPKYSDMLKNSTKKGVEVYAYRTKTSPFDICVSEQLEIIFD